MQFTERDLDELQVQAEAEVDEAYKEFVKFFLGGRLEPGVQDAEAE